MTTESKTIEELLNKLAPNRNIIGIDGDLDVYEGYDARLYQLDLKTPNDDEDSIQRWKELQFTSNEKLLLSDEMIRRWTKYRDRITHDSYAPETAP
jgi:hypothetical protein